MFLIRAANRKSKRNSCFKLKWKTTWRPLQPVGKVCFDQTTWTSIALIYFPFSTGILQGMLWCKWVGGEVRWGETYRLVYSKLGHLVERHLLHNHFPDLQLELLAQHQLHRLIQFPAIVNDANIVGPSRLEMELYLLIKSASLGLCAALWNNPHPTFPLGCEWLLRIAVVARPGVVLGLVSGWKCVGSCSTTVASSGCILLRVYVCVCVRLTLVPGVNSMYLLPGLRISLRIGFTVLSASFCSISIHFGFCFTVYTFFICFPLSTPRWPCLSVWAKTACLLLCFCSCACLIKD